MGRTFNGPWQTLGAAAVVASFLVSLKLLTRPELGASRTTNPERIHEPLRQPRRRVRAPDPQPHEALVCLQTRAAMVVALNGSWEGSLSSICPARAPRPQGSPDEMLDVNVGCRRLPSRRARAPADRGIDKPPSVHVGTCPNPSLGTPSDGAQGVGFEGSELRTVNGCTPRSFVRVLSTTSTSWHCRPARWGVVMSGPAVGETVASHLNAAASDR